jgi:hypothetical protein
MVSAVMTFALVGCGVVQTEPPRNASADGPRRDASRQERQENRDRRDRTDEAAQPQLVAPIARKAIERKVQNKKVANVACTSKFMRLQAGFVTQCTATLDDVGSGWTLTFIDDAGAYSLVRRPDEQ